MEIFLFNKLFFWFERVRIYTPFVYMDGTAVYIIFNIWLWIVECTRNCTVKSIEYENEVNASEKEENVILHSIYVKHDAHARLHIHIDFRNQEHFVYIDFQYAASASYFNIISELLIRNNANCKE